jgi:hypothetical protein
VTKRKENRLEAMRVYRGFSDKDSRWHYQAFTDWHALRIEAKRYPVEPGYSPLPSTLDDIKKRQKVIIYDDKMDYGRFNSNAIMDRIIIHCEGLELETLKQNIKTFQKRRPFLSVACYHTEDGYLKIPLLLMKSLENYYFTFRNHAYMGVASYLYCEPNEKR